MRRLGACLRRNVIESLRDWKITMFALVFAPAFVLVMSGFLSRGNRPYTIGVAAASEASGFLEQLRASTYDDGVPHYVIEPIDSTASGLPALADRRIDALVTIPADFDSDLARAAAVPSARPPRLQLHGDPGNLRYAVAAILVYSDLDVYMRRVSGQRAPVEVDETLTGQGKGITEFDAAVPGLVVFALLNVLLTAGAAFLRDVDRGTMLRLALSRLRTWEFITAAAVVQAAICVAAMLTALWAAVAVGYHFRGTVAAMTVLAVLSSIGVIGLALLTAACLRTVHDLLTVGVAPYFVIMFFSGLMFPMPPSQLLRVGSHTVRYQDLLPLASSVGAFDQVMNYGAGLGQLGFELALVAVVSGLWFALGLWVYGRRHMTLA